MRIKKWNGKWESGFLGSTIFSWFFLCLFCFFNCTATAPFHCRFLISLCFHRRQRCCSSCCCWLYASWQRPMCALDRQNVHEFLVSKKNFQFFSIKTILEFSAYHLLDARISTAQQNVVEVPAEGKQQKLSIFVCNCNKIKRPPDFLKHWHVNFRTETHKNTGWALDTAGTIAKHNMPIAGLLQQEGNNSGQTMRFLRLQFCAPAGSVGPSPCLVHPTAGGATVPFPAKSLCRTRTECAQTAR